MSARTTPMARLLAASAVVAGVLGALVSAPYASASIPGITPGDLIKIGNQGCSVGPYVDFKDGGVGFLTAGHCGSAGSVVEWKGKGNSYLQIGTVVGSVNDKGAGKHQDFAAVKLNMNAIRPALGGSYLVQTYLTGAELKNSMAHGGKFEACSIGVTSGERCGQLIDVSDNETLIADFPSDHGDSGGPVFVRSASKGKYVAIVGIQNARSLSDDTTLIMQIEPILKSFGLMLHAEHE